MPGGMPDPVASVSVVIPTIGRARLAEVVAATLADATATEVVVVADRDPDRVDAVLAGAGLLEDPRVLVVAGPGRGPAAARQTGIARAGGDLILLLDDDVVPGPGLVAAHRDAHGAGDRLIVVGPMPVAAELRAASAIARVYANDYDAEWAGLLANPAAVVHDLWGGNVSIRRADGLAVPQVGELGD